MKRGHCGFLVDLWWLFSRCWFFITSLGSLFCSFPFFFLLIAVILGGILYFRDFLLLRRTNMCRQWLKIKEKLLDSTFLEANFAKKKALFPQLAKLLLVWGIKLCQASLSSYFEEMNVWDFIETRSKSKYCQASSSYKLVDWDLSYRIKYNEPAKFPALIRWKTSHIFLCPHSH